MTMSVPVVVGLMLAAYALVMGYLAVGLWIQHRQPVHVARTRRGRTRRDRTARGWTGLVGRVLGTAVGGYSVLMAVVVAYDRGVGHSGGGLSASASTGCALLAGIALPVFLIASWLWTRRDARRSRTTKSRR